MHFKRPKTVITDSTLNPLYDGLRSENENLRKLATISSSFLNNLEANSKDTSRTEDARILAAADLHKKTQSSFDAQFNLTVDAIEKRHEGLKQELFTNKVTPTLADSTAAQILYNEYKEMNGNEQLSMLQDTRKANALSILANGGILSEKDTKTLNEANTPKEILGALDSVQRDLKDITSMQKEFKSMSAINVNHKAADEIRSNVYQG